MRQSALPSLRDRGRAPAPACRIRAQDWPTWPAAAAGIRVGIGFNEFYGVAVEYKDQETGGVFQGKIGGPVVVIANRIEQGAGFVTGISFIDIETKGDPVGLQEFGSDLTGITHDLIISDSSF